MWCLSHITFPGTVWAVPGLFWTNIVRPLTETVRRRTNVASPYGARTVGIICLRAPYGFKDHTHPVNSPCWGRKGPVRAPYGHIRRKFWLCQFPYVSITVPCGSATGPVGFEKYWIFPCGARTTPARALHGVYVESCELFDQTLSVGLQPCQAVRGPWPNVTTRTAPA